MVTIPVGHRVFAQASCEGRWMDGWSSTGRSLICKSWRPWHILVAMEGLPWTKAKPYIISGIVTECKWLIWIWTKYLGSNLQVFHRDYYHANKETVYRSVKPFCIGCGIDRTWILQNGSAGNSWWTILNVSHCWIIAKLDKVATVHQIQVQICICIFLATSSRFCFPTTNTKSLCNSVNYLLKANTYWYLVEILLKGTIERVFPNFLKFGGYRECQHWDGNLFPIVANEPSK